MKLTPEQKEAIVSRAEPIGVLINKIGLAHVKGKDRKKKLNEYKSFVYNIWDEGGYIKRPVYKLGNTYYFSA